MFLKVVLTLGVWGFLFFSIKQEFIYFYKILLVTERRVRTTELRLPFHWVMVVHSFNPSSQEARQLDLSSGPAHSTEQVPRQPGLHRKTSQNEKKRNGGEALSHLKWHVMDVCPEAILHDSLCTCVIRGVPFLIPISNLRHSGSGDS